MQNKNDQSSSDNPAFIIEHLAAAFDGASAPASQTLARRRASIPEARNAID
jgi:hypothetical protein